MGPDAQGGRGGIVYVASNQIVIAYRARDGRQLWSSLFNGTGDGSPAVDADSVYVAGACQQDHAFDRETGAERWHHSTGCSGGGGSTMAVAAGSVYSRDITPGNLILSAATGDVLGSFGAGPMPAVAHGRMYALSGSTLTAVSDSGLGTNAWDFTGDGNLVTAPVVAGDLVFVGSSSGELYALDAATGAPSWSTNVGSAILGPNEFNLFERTYGLGPPTARSSCRPRATGSSRTAWVARSRRRPPTSPRRRSTARAVRATSSVPTSGSGRACRAPTATSGSAATAPAPVRAARTSQARPARRTSRMRPTSTRRCACASPPPTAPARPRRSSRTRAPRCSRRTRDPDRADDQRPAAPGRHADRQPGGAGAAA